MLGNWLKKNFIKSQQQWTEEIFEATLQDFLTLFEAESFFDELKFLVYYQGKDFAKALTKELPNFSIENYYKYAKKKIWLHKIPRSCRTESFYRKLV